MNRQEEDPKPVKVSFEQTQGGVRMIYVSLTDRRGKISGRISRTETVSENPLVNLDWHADGTLLGIEIIN
jgi:hypothetical protein